MLTGLGYRIIRNTEHTPLEFGKDVVAISPEGKLVAIFPAELFDPLLQHTLRFHKGIKAPELRRCVSSAAVMTALALHSFSRRRNHSRKLPHG
jgi:hypothetical protein